MLRLRLIFYLSDNSLLTWHLEIPSYNVWPPNDVAQNFANTQTFAFWWQTRTTEVILSEKLLVSDLIPTNSRFEVIVKQKTCPVFRIQMNFL